MSRQGIQLHPRMSVVADAESEFTKMFLAIEEKYELTYGEMFRILSQRMDRVARDLVREERHPDEPDKGGDEA